MDLQHKIGQRARLAAAIILALYALLALGTELGASVAGQGLDPVWAGVQARGTLRVAVDFGFYPFTWVEDGQPAGYDIDLAQAVARKLGLRAEFVPSGLDSIYDDLAGRRADMGASALPYAPELSWRVSFSEFYFNAGQVLVVRDDSSIAGLNDLTGLVVAAPLGSDADTEARRRLAAGEHFQLESRFDTVDAALAAVRTGAADAAFADNASALIAIERAPGLRIVEPALTLEPYALAFAPDAFELRERVNRALAELRAEGFFEELGRRWFVGR
jgi:polar amino acid transport system substrate-binding protein